ncbi:MAG: hypothetical protein ACKO8G_05820 [Actinomycetota bacterium]
MALMVAFLSFVIATAVLAQAIHNVTQSGYGRKRLTAVNAAEAGINWFTKVANTNPTAALSGTGWTSGTCASLFTISPTATGTCYTASGTAATVPEQASYSVRVMYSTSNPCPATGGVASPCDLSAGIPLSTLPTDFLNLYARVQSTGTVGVTKRTLESYIRLRPIRSGVATGLVAYSTCLQGGGNSRIEVDGTLAVEFQPEPWPLDPSGNAICPTGGSVNVGSGDTFRVFARGGVGGSLIIRGGGLKVCNTCKFSVDRDVWAETGIELGGTSANMSLTSCSTSTASQCVGNDVKAPSVTFGSNAYVGGRKIICSSPCPPETVFPIFTWDPTQWVGWTIVENTQTPNDLFTQMSNATTPTVFRITGTPSTAIPPATDPNQCDVVFTGSVLTLKTKVAIVSRCRFIFERSGAILSGTGSLMLITASPAVDPTCRGTSTRYGGVQDVTIANNQSFTAPVYIYTPCVLWIAGNQDSSSPYAVQGQFAARFLYIKNSVRLSERDIASYVNVVPGAVTRFFVDVKFLREIPTA